MQALREILAGLVKLGFYLRIERKEGLFSLYQE